MYKIQRDRLLGELALGLNAQQANAIIARAYGHESFDPETDQLQVPIRGLMMVKTPDEIRAIPDRVLQMMEFVRMSQNMVIPGLPDVLNGHAQGTLIAIMWGFSNFDALEAYAESDRIDPASTDPAEIARFKLRTGFMPPSQFLLGRSYSGNTMIIHTEPDETSQWIDQELCLNSLEDLQVALVRCTTDGDDYINRYSRNHLVFRQELSEDYSSYLLGARKQHPESRLAVSLVPKTTYTLEHLVAAHLAALSEGSPVGRALIIDCVPIIRDLESITAGLKLADNAGLNLVYVTDNPDAELWDLFQARLIFGFDSRMQLSQSPEMNLALVQASPFVGLRDHELNLVYHSTETGSVYGTVQLVPEERKDQPKGAQILKRIFGAPRLG